MLIQGSICALATPFSVDGALDLEGFVRLLDYQIDNGTQALLVAGSTGEAHMLADAEFDRLLACAVEHVAGRVPVLAGCGGAATAATIAACRRLAGSGVDAALVVTPYYVRPDQRGLEYHFRRVADEAGLPILMYNVPARTGCDMQPETVAALRDHEQIIGIKEAVGDADRIQAMAQLAGDDFVYLSGDDGTAVDAMLAGAAGTISVVVNALPRLFRAICGAARAGDAERARALQGRLQPMLDALACGPNPVPVKAALAGLGVCGEHVRAPLLPLDDEAARQTLVRQAGFLVNEAGV